MSEITSQAFETLKAALQADESYAWSWHCVAWSCAFDEGLETGAANRAAARFMSMAFDIDTSKHPHFKPEHQRAAVQAARALRPSADDWQWVPKTPTPEMLDKGAMEIAMNMQRVQTAESSAHCVFRAMLAFAPPTPPSPPQTCA